MAAGFKPDQALEALAVSAASTITNSHSTSPAAAQPVFRSTGGGLISLSKIYSLTRRERHDSKMFT